MEPGTLTVAFSTIASLVAIGGSALVARRYQRMGGGAAQTKLNATLLALNAALEDQVAALQIKVTDLERERAELKLTAVELRRERQNLQQDLDDLRAEVRALGRRTGKAETSAKNVATALEANKGVT